MRSEILFLTNRHNNASDEDRVVIKFLNESFVLKVSAPQSCFPLLNTVDGVIIRNIWPTHEYAEEWEDVKTYLRASDLPIYNPLGWKGDVEGKNYLVTLHSKGYPVIPSVDRVSDIGQIPRAEHYWIEPKRSCDGIGAKRLTRDELYRMNPHGYIIQPFLEFEYEPSFFFVDGKFHHVISTRHRLLNDRVVRYSPSRHGSCNIFVEISHRTKTVDIDFFIESKKS